MRDPAPPSCSGSRPSWPLSAADEHVSRMVAHQGTVAGLDTSMLAVPQAESALLITCPQSEHVVGSHRAQYDRAAQLGVPAHITVIYPFQARDRMTEADHVRLQQIFTSFRASRWWAFQRRGSTKPCCTWSLKTHRPSSNSLRLSSRHSQTSRLTEVRSSS